jgi:hypothetical protein
LKRVRHSSFGSRRGRVQLKATARPEAKAAFDELVRQVRHPFDPNESDQIKPTNLLSR